MTNGYDVESSSLRAYAKAVDDAAARIERIRKRTSALTIPDHAFGKLPESGALKKDYEDKSEQAAKDLTDAIDSMELIAKGMRASAGGYDDNEDVQSVRFGGSN
ncbi:hypothetical protein JGS22_010320 [Streptomyces sp. P38-E01]|uniref:Uncharacterized protein n=1 Tax=Streptomyces tardus TaxID=2780544 RepID=A0A949N8J6_9ACTN|nr:hypothetical protein [Streptomyces tardus]MBU7597993.1 hypothetical protein [Streptomyces tardus]